MVMFFTKVILYKKTLLAPQSFNLAILSKRLNTFCVWCLWGVPDLPELQCHIFTVKESPKPLIKPYHCIGRKDTQHQGPARFYFFHKAIMWVMDVGCDFSGDSVHSHFKPGVASSHTIHTEFEAMDRGFCWLSLDIEVAAYPEIPSYKKLLNQTTKGKPVSLWSAIQKVWRGIYASYMTPRKFTMWWSPTELADCDWKYTMSLFCFKHR